MGCPARKDRGRWPQRVTTLVAEVRVPPGPPPVLEALLQVLQVLAVLRVLEALRSRLAQRSGLGCRPRLALYRSVCPPA